MKIVKPELIIFDWNGTLVYNDHNNLIKLLPNALKVIKKLNDMKILISVASNSSINFLEKTIKRYGLGKYFLNIIGTKGDIEYRKPDKEIIEYAANGSGILDFNTDNIWMIGNSMQDIQTAYNAHIKPIIFGNELLDNIIYSYGFEKNQKTFFLKNHKFFLELLEDMENENA